MKQRSLFSSVSNDLSSGLVVFLVALPLCLGIAMGSSAPSFAGIITGVIGGIVVGSLSGSSLSVSGPAAGLTTIVSAAILGMNSYGEFLTAVFLAGAIQLLLGFLRAGIIALFFPYSVIKGMLAAIGLILIIKQIPVALGDDIFYEELSSLMETHRWVDFENELYWTLQDFQPSAVYLSIVSLFILAYWDSPSLQRFKFFKAVPGPLFVVLMGIVVNELLKYALPAYSLVGTHVVELPIAKSLTEFSTFFTHPDFSASAFKNRQVYEVAFTVAIVASVETLLSVEATDKLDPEKHVTPPNRELMAQGVGNMVSGLLGGIPMTSVIVRSSANVSSGAKTKLSAISHGVLLLLTVVFIPGILNKIPLASLAAVLILIGYKLTRVSIYKNMYELGKTQFLPFIATILGVLFINLLWGIGIGIVLAFFFVLKVNYETPVAYLDENTEGEHTVTINLARHVSFLNKARFQKTLDELPPNTHIIIDGTASNHIDYDVIEIISDFIESAEAREIDIQVKGIDKIDVLLKTH